MGNRPGLVTGSKVFITVNGNPIQMLHGTYAYHVTALHGDFAYPLIGFSEVPDAFFSSFYTYLRVLHKFKIGKKEEIQHIINNSDSLVPKLWRSYMQNMLFNKKAQQLEKRRRQEKPKTYNPLDKYRSSMKGKFR